MKNSLKVLALASAFAIASISAMVQSSEAQVVGIGCESGGNNCELIWIDGSTWLFRFEWIMVEM